MDKITQTLQFARSTKGTHFYEAADQTTARVKTMYIQKEAFMGKAPPAKIQVDITEAK